MRPMRLSKREVKEIHKLQEIIEECHIVRLGLQDQEGMFIVPVNFGWEMEKEEEGLPLLRLYFHSASQGRKADAIRENPRAAFEMDLGYGLITGDYSCDYSYAYKSVMGSGLIRCVKGEEKEKGLSLILAHEGVLEKPKFRQESLLRTNVYCIESRSYTGKMREKKTVE